MLAKLYTQAQDGLSNQVCHAKIVYVLTMFERILTMLIAGAVLAGSQAIMKNLRNIKPTAANSLCLTISRIKTIKMKLSVEIIFSSGVSTWIWIKPLPNTPNGK